jgi:hypothetical protein
MIPEPDERYYTPPRRLGRRGIAAWIVLAVIVIGAIATLLIWVSHQLGKVAV